MGKIYTPAYRVEAFERTPRGNIIKHSWAWNRDSISTKDLEEEVMERNKSYQPGGVNFTGGEYVHYYSSAKLIHQATGREVTIWRAASFQVM